MSDKKTNTPGDVAASPRAEDENSGALADPHGQNITASQRRQGNISALLQTGAAHALTARELAERTGFTVREVTRSIQRARLAGMAVCASGEGFYMALDAGELEGYLRALNRRLREVGRTRDALARALDELTGQMRIEL